MTVSVLLIEKADSSIDWIFESLEDSEYKVSVARSEQEALQKATSEMPDLIILNGTSTGIDGREICQALHDKVAEISIILILAETKRGEDVTGATFVLTPPFTYRKLFNRVRSILKSEEGEILRAGKLTLNLGTRRVNNGSKERRLNPKELELLKVLMRSPGRVLSRKFLMKKIWETDFMGDTGTLNVHICRLRQKIEEKPSSPKYVRTVRGVGYRFDIPEEAGDETESET
jgi:two-component system alkaline phosphatase synthesis response regulator PhoP